ncbi:hypothetical protein [Acidihalobacter prosperus]|uniref:Uncharacterized protein n=1 Tax=Acidihalobacter prosperus TaxID=160660 RepID=A0A1A6C2K4_9GAMM|nr:hypothetical protein [Acidihalobacter prosperus]OBS08796.1 hypothetical protein Thpro_023046 [Acidihalobacter prosperus]
MPANLQRPHARTEYPTELPLLPEGDEVALYSPNQIHRIQLARGEAACFRTDARYACRKLDCPLGAECRRRIAVWRR